MVERLESIIRSLDNPRKGLPRGVAAVDAALALWRWETGRSNQLPSLSALAERWCWWTEGGNLAVHKVRLTLQRFEGWPAGDASGLEVAGVPDVHGPLLYALRAADAVKIGFTAGSLRDRAKTLQGSCPTPLVYAGHLVGCDVVAEADLHHALSIHRRHGEWFDWNPKVASALRHAGFVGVPE